MIVAVIVVGMVQVAVDDVIDVVAVGNRLVTAARTMVLTVSVLGALVVGRAFGRIDAADAQAMFLDLIARRMVKMAVVEIIDVAVMLDGLVAAAVAVAVRVVGVNMNRHGGGPFVG